jgi:CBS domain-containing protein
MAQEVSQKEPDCSRAGCSQAAHAAFFAGCSAGQGGVGVERIGASFFPFQPTDKESQMQTIQDVMTRDVQSIAPQETVQRAAQMMDELNVGAIPVLDGQKLVGMITDRDITVRSTAAGQAPDQARVGDVMSIDVRTCAPDQTVDEVLGQMGDVQIRRLPVIDQQSQEVIGIVSLGDMAAKHSAGIDHTLEEISTPAEPDRSTVGSETRH